MTKWGGGEERDHWAYRTSSGSEMAPLGADQGQHLLVQQEGDPGPGDLVELPISPSNDPHGWWGLGYLEEWWCLERVGHPLPPHQHRWQLLVTQGYHQQTSLLQGFFILRVCLQSYLSLYPSEAARALKSFLIFPIFHYLIRTLGQEEGVKEKKEETESGLWHYNNNGSR